MSQLVRYATLWWISNSTRPSPITSVGGSANMAEFVNVRFSVEDMALVREVAAQMDLDRGAVVRYAVRAWLAVGDFTALGDPLSITGSDTSRLAG